MLKIVHVRVWWIMEPKAAQHALKVSIFKLFRLDTVRKKEKTLYLITFVTIVAYLLQSNFQYGLSSGVHTVPVC